MQHISLLSHFVFLCLWSPFHRPQGHSSSSFWRLLRGENVGPRACVGFLASGIGAFPLTGGAGPCPSDGQDCVKGCVLMWPWAQYALGCLSWWLCGLRLCSSGACRLLDGAKSWCQNTDLQEISHWLILPETSVTSVLSLTVSNSYLHLLRSLSKTHGFNPGFHGALTLCWVPACMRPCIHPPRCFPQPSGAPALKRCWPSRLSSLGVLLSNSICSDCLGGLFCVVTSLSSLCGFNVFLCEGCFE